MPRPLRLLDGRKALPPTLVVLFICSLLPARWLAWEGVLGTLTQTLVAPITSTGIAFSRAVRPPARREASSELIASLLAERDTALLLQRQAELENEHLHRLVQELQGGIELAPDLSLKQVAASVIGRDADLARLILHVRAGSAQGVVNGSVAVVDGVQLLGRVQSVGPRVSAVQLVTDKSAGRIRGLVMIEGAPSPGGVECDLEPASGGVLRGRVAASEPRAGEQPPEVRAGQVVRLYDATWPRNAQMLELGTVEGVEPDRDQPVRRIITVRPRFDMTRASEVILRVTGESEGEPPAGGRGPG